MIALCKKRFPNAQWIVADMRRLKLDERFDGILAWDSFFHLTHEDQAAMFPVFAAHAAPGAALMFTSGRDRGVAMGTFEGEPLYHASLEPAEYEALLSANGFAVAAQVFDDPSCGGHSVWLARRKTSDQSFSSQTSPISFLPKSACGSSRNLWKPARS